MKVSESTESGADFVVLLLCLEVRRPVLRIGASPEELLREFFVVFLVRVDVLGSLDEEVNFSCVDASRRLLLWSELPDESSELTSLESIPIGTWSCILFPLSFCFVRRKNRDNFFL